MAFPGASFLVNDLKSRVLEASTTSSGASATAVTIPFRAKYLYTLYSKSGLGCSTQSVGGTTALNIAINGSTATADSFFTNPLLASTTTSSAPAIGANTVMGPSPNVSLFLNQGDQITTIAGSTLRALFRRACFAGVLINGVGL